MPTMQFEFMDDLVLLVVGNSVPTDPEWATYANAVRETVASRTLSGLLVSSHGGGPNARQRKIIVDAYGENAVPVAICSSSGIARAITTAISWFYPQPMRSFSYGEVEAALEFLKIDKRRWPDIITAVNERRKALRTAA